MSRDHGDSGTHEVATRLIPATPAHFDWAMAGAEAPPLADGLCIAPGGLEPGDVLAWLKRTAMAVKEATGEWGAWLVVGGNEVVGLISFTRPPREGLAEIGYGVTESRRGRGHATRAVGLAVVEAAALGLDVMAETAADNRPSQIVLERNGFRRCGERVDAEEGLRVAWRRDQRASARV